jgi:hypothetical protein
VDPDLAEACLAGEGLARSAGPVRGAARQIGDNTPVGRAAERGHGVREASVRRWFDMVVVEAGTSVHKARALGWCGSMSRTLVRLLVLATLAATGVAGADSGPRQLYAQPSPLAGVIAGLAEAPPAVRLEFAGMVVDALVLAYEMELDPAIFERPRGLAGQRKLLRWQHATAPLLGELHALQAGLYLANDVEVRLDRHNRILLRIDGRPLWVAWPRVDTQTRIEREIAAEFCRRHDCGRGIVATVAGAGRVPAASQGTWLLSQRRPPAWEHADGLRCEFADLSDRAGKEAACRAIVADLKVLAEALEAAVRHGDRVQWEHLALQDEPVGALHRVVVNEHGDYVQASVPALAQAPVDWGAARRWLRARAEGRSAAATILPATARR